MIHKYFSHFEFPPLESSSHSELLTTFWAKHSKLSRSRWIIILQPHLPSHPTSHTICYCYKHSLGHPALRLLLKSFPLPISPYSVCPSIKDSRNSHPLMFPASPDFYNSIVRFRFLLSSVIIFSLVIWMSVSVAHHLEVNEMRSHVFLLLAPHPHVIFSACHLHHLCSVLLPLPFSLFCLTPSLPFSWLAPSLL